MILEEKTSHHRHEFTAVLRCEHCDSFQYIDSGYDDYTYHTKVIPAIMCVKCHKRTNEDIPEGITDPRYENSRPCKKVQVLVDKWELDA